MAIRRSVPFKRWLAGFALAAWVALSLAATSSDVVSDRWDKNNPLFTGSNVPMPVRAILQRACQDCHSANTAWPWYSRIPPISWKIQNDVKNGRKILDLSNWNGYTEGQRRGFSIAIQSAIQNQAMPPQNYLWLHSEGRLTSDERELIREWALRAPMRASR
jgi:hypothetical protein